MLVHTKAVRKIMREHGCLQMFTNKYDTCRTVKCYANRHDTTVPPTGLMAALLQYKQSNNLDDETMRIKVIKSPHAWCNSRSLIVRFPLD